MPKLNDAQTILLSTAAQRADGHLFPPPATLGADMERIGRAVVALMKGRYVNEVPVTIVAQAWRVDGDERFGAVITDAGRTALGIEPEGAAEHEPVVSRPSKAQLVLSLLRRKQGATLDELVEATGWLPHTMRAALTGFRKKGHDIARGKRGDVTCYMLAV